MPFFKEIENPVFIPILASTRERNQLRFARFCFQLSKRLKITPCFSPEYFVGKDVILVDDILTTGQSFIQMKRQLIKQGAKSVIGLFLGKSARDNTKIQTIY